MSPKPPSPRASSICPKCGLRLKDHTPHTLDDCIQELRHCHKIATDALGKVQGIIRAFTTDPKIIKRIDLIISSAIDEIGECVQAAETDLTEEP